MHRIILILGLVVATLSAPSIEAGVRPGRQRNAAARTQRATRAQNRQRRPTVEQIQKRKNPWKALGRLRQRVIKKFRSRRNDWVVARGEIFRRITQERNYSRDYVLQRTKKTTAFLDWSDPGHPQYDPNRKTGEQRFLDKIPEARRAHILVVPNKPRQHIARTLGGQITGSDLEAASTTMKEAEKLAKKLGIKNPRIWINSPDSISVGYLHVHILGERTKAYPAPLAPNGRRKPALAAN